MFSAKGKIENGIIYGWIFILIWAQESEKHLSDGKVIDSFQNKEEICLKISGTKRKQIQNSSV